MAIPARPQLPPDYPVGVNPPTDEQARTWVAVTIARATWDAIYDHRHGASAAAAAVFIVTRMRMRNCPMTLDQWRDIAIPRLIGAFPEARATFVRTAQPRYFAAYRIPPGAEGEPRASRAEGEPRASRVEPPAPTLARLERDHTALMHRLDSVRTALIEAQNAVEAAMQCLKQE